MLGQAQARDLVPLMRELSHAAARAREAGDVELYEELRGRLESISRIYEGVGTLEDQLELEQARKGFLGQIGAVAEGTAKLGTLVLVALGALVLLPRLLR